MTNGTSFSLSFEKVSADRLAKPSGCLVDVRQLLRMTMPNITTVEEIHQDNPEYTTSPRLVQFILPPTKKLQHRSIPNKVSRETACMYHWPIVQGMAMCKNQRVEYTCITLKRKEANRDSVA